MQLAVLVNDSDFQGPGRVLSSSTSTCLCCQSACACPVPTPSVSRRGPRLAQVSPWPLANLGRGMEEQ